jgi:hypothetical protein
MTLKRVKPVLKRVQPIRPPEYNMSVISVDPPVFQDGDGIYYLKKFGLLFECFPSGYIKDRAKKPGFTVSYGKVSRSVSDQDKAIADLVVREKMRKIFGPNYDFHRQPIYVMEEDNYEHKENSE